MLEWLFGKKKEEPQKKKKSQSEDKWMYQFMVQYLSSPLWRVSILDFVDNKCIVFDNQQQNKFQYTTIHNQFKQLVGNLVDGMMEQIGMSQEKLAQTIEKGFESKQHRKIFNQLLLADDFMRFKQLMLKRNRALQKQAIQALQNGPTANGEGHKISNLDKQREVIRQSQRQQQQRQRLIQQQQEEQLRRVLQMSKLDSSENNALKQLQKKIQQHEQVKNEQEQKQEEIKKQSPKKQSRRRSKQQKLQPVSSGLSKSGLGQLPPIKAPVQKSKNEDEQQFTKPVTKPIYSPQIKKQSYVSQTIKQQPIVKQQQSVIQEQKQVQKQVSQQQSLQQRKQRLVAQRQKIRKQKQQQRKKQMDQQLNQKQKHSQPSSQVNTIVLQQDGFYDHNVKQIEPTHTNKASVPEDELKRRKELMNKIKNRIIDDF